jgi:hypothetical protein
VIAAKSRSTQPAHRPAAAHFSATRDIFRNKPLGERPWFYAQSRCESAPSRIAILRQSNVLTQQSAMMRDECACQPAESAIARMAHDADSAG